MTSKMLHNIVFLLIGITFVFASGCIDTSYSDNASEEISNATEDEESELEIETIDPDDFAVPVANAYFPLEVGTTSIFIGKSDGENIRLEIYVTDQTKEILGVTTTIVREREWEAGELVEGRYNWFANDNEGNVWYFGEESKEYKNGVVASTTGSWEAGVDGAEPGIIMMADPQAGDVYQQEYYEGEAEDMAEVVSRKASVSVQYGSYDNCLLTKEWSPLEPGIEEYKYYASGVGLLFEEDVTQDDDKIGLVAITTE